jgi:DNA replication protein DnaD
MPNYVILVNWTDQGIKNVKDSVKGAEAFETAIEKVRLSKKKGRKRYEELREDREKDLQTEMMEKQITSYRRYFALSIH